MFRHNILIQIKFCQIFLRFRIMVPYGGNYKGSVNFKSDLIFDDIPQIFDGTQVE